jgi:ankyrin repeat protein
MTLISSRTLSREDVGSPIHKAVEYGQLSVLEMLLNAGADITLKDGMGRTARDIAEEKGLGANELAMLWQR